MISILVANIYSIRFNFSIPNDGSLMNLSYSISDKYLDQTIKQNVSVLKLYTINSFKLYNSFNINKSDADIIPIDSLKHEHFLWMENKKHEYKNYDFLLIDKNIEFSLNKNDIIKLNGIPKAIGTCYNYEIIIYNQGMLDKY